MNRKTMVLAVLLAFQITTLRAQEESKAWWNPFSKSSGAASSDVRESSFFNGSEAAEKSMFTMPKLPWATTAGSPKAKGESTFSKMGRTTKRMWGNTVDFLNPFDTPPPQKAQGYQPQIVEKKSGGGLFGWMSQEERIESPTSVNGFLSLPRPKF